MAPERQAWVDDLGFICFAVKGISHHDLSKIYISKGGLAPPLELCMGT